MDMRDQIIERLSRLDSTEKQQVLHYVLQLEQQHAEGFSGDELVKHAGGLSKEDADEMRQIIEEGCERIDWENW